MSFQLRNEASCGAEPGTQLIEGSLPSSPARATCRELRVDRIQANGYHERFPRQCDELRQKIPDWVERVELASREGFPRLKIRFAEKPQPGEVGVFNRIVNDIFGFNFEIGRNDVQPGESSREYAKWLKARNDQKLRKSFFQQVEESLPPGVLLLQNYRYQLKFSPATVHTLVVLRVVVHPHSEPKIEDWRRLFEREHGVSVLLKRENVSAGLMRQLQRFVRGRSVLEAGDVPAIKRLLQGYFHGGIPRARSRKALARLCFPRRDLTSMRFFTIDGQHEPDPEDAVHIERRANGNYDLHVAIADVTEHVTPSGRVERAALRAGPAIYGRRSVIHPFGETAVRTLARFDPGQARHAIVGRFEITPHGEVLEREFFLAHVKIHEKLSWDDVLVALQVGEPEELCAMLEQFQTVAGALRARRLQKEGVIRIKDSNAGQSIIEESMLLLTREIAAEMKRRGQPVLYTVLPELGPRALQQLVREVSAHGIPCEVDDLRHGPRLVALLEILESNRHRFLVNRILESFLMRTSIDLEDRGHSVLGGGLVQLKTRKGLYTNQVQVAAALSGAGSVFSEAELKRRVRLLNRKGHALSDNLFRLRVLESLLHHLPHCGKEFEARCIKDMAGSSRMQVVGFGRNIVCAEDEVLPGPEAGPFPVVLRGYCLKRRAYLFSRAEGAANGREREQHIAG